MVLLRLSAFALALAGFVHADAANAGKAEGITPLSPDAISTFSPFTWFASTAYCKASTTLDWTCGDNCQANPDFVSVASGGDGSATQYWYVGYSPSQNTVIVAHQGTNPVQLLARLTDENILLLPLDQDLFPGVPSSVLAHTGFTLEHSKTASTILSSVQQTLAATNATSVTVVGHSLGAALSLLDGVFLRIQLDASVNVRVFGYGMPRVGNRAFANWVDNNLSGQVTHVNNLKDPVPILPSMFLGFRHPEGEIHITDSSTWVSCPGQDNPSTHCIVGAVPGVIQGKVSNHDGPYNGIKMGCSLLQTEAEPAMQRILGLGHGFINQITAHFHNFVF